MICFGGWSGEGLSFYSNDEITCLDVNEGLEEGIIYSLLEDTDGNLWIGTRRGLFCFDGRTFTKYCKEKGFISLDHQSSAIDKKGILWFGTKNGLYLYNKKFLQTITTDDGLPGNGISSLLPQEDSSIIIGTYRGIVRYNSNKSQPPYIGIEEVIADRIYKNPKKLKLDSSAIITVHLSSINLSTNKIRYSYILEGYMSEWQDTWNNHIRFENLPEGQYTLKVMAINRDLVWSLEPATLEITIAFGNLGQLKAEYEAEIGRMEEELKLHHQTNKQNRVLLKLAKSKSLINGDLDTALQEITTASAFTIEIDQVSVWLFEENRTKLRCTDSYSCSQNKHKKGNKFELTSCPHYFEALEGFRVIVANDSRKDFRKRELLEKGIISEQIVSSMDAAIRVGGQTVGVVWYEHVGTPRKWKIEEEQFASTIADFVALAMEACERKKFQEEQQKLELQMQRAQKLESLGVLAGGIAHDFNNLLTVILGNSDLILNELSTVHKAHKEITEIGSIWDKVREIKTASDHAANLSRQMLAYSGKGKFLSEILNLNKIVIEMNRLLRASIPKKIRMKFSLTDNLSSINADNSQISQVIMNLITNAAEAIGDNRGIITVSTGMVECDNDYLEKTGPNSSLSCGSYVYLDISDTGCGMDEETQLKIFDPFFTTKFTGRGLGLAVVFGIVRGHNGAINVLSKKNIGTTFRVLFPSVKEIIYEKRKELGTNKAWTSSGTILLVDDEEMVRSVGRRMLEMFGFDVLLAEDGIQGIQIFKENLDKIRVVILDLTMPKMSGEEAFYEMHQLRSDIPIILSSGYIEHNIVERFSGKGLANFVQKPYQLNILRQKIYDVLGDNE
jgi:signal transduction histidine kinase